MIKAYASYFSSYLLANLKEKESIEKIILFGSAAKDEATKGSDVDIFVGIKKESKKIKNEIEKVLKNFYKSRESLLFKSKGIDNKINLIIGKLDKWINLKKSIESTGIVLYGKYVPSGISGKKHIVAFWDKVGKNRGAFLNKIYGFKANKKHYKGLIERLGGKKLGKSSIMVPVENKDEILKLIKIYKVNAKIIEIYA
jgi:predicted nucleotidyltransferase